MPSKASRRRFLACSLLSCCLIAAPAARAQQKKKAAKADDAAAAARTTQVQQAALLSLEAAADESRDIGDYAARAALSGEIVKLLAASNPARCRRLLDDLFDGALDARRQTQGGVASAADRPDVDATLRNVIKVAAGFDAGLARAYAERYAEFNRREDASGGTAGTVSPAVADLHLRLATELVEGNPALAVETAKRSLPVAVSGQTLVFLETLRRKDARLANEFLASALHGVSLRGGSQINELFLLYSYALSPRRILSVVQGRLVLRQIPEYQDIAQDRPADAEVVRQYLLAAARIMTDPNRYASGVERLTSGAVGDLYFDRIIEPDVRAHVPAMSERLTLQRNYLENLLDPSLVKASQERAERWHGSRAAAAGDSDPQSPESQLRRAEDIPDPDRRDQAYYQIATTAAREKKYDFALATAEKLSSKNRETARQFVRYVVAEGKIKDGALEEGEPLARGDGEAVRRAYLLTLIADSLVRRKDVARASEILDEVESIAAKLGASREGVAVLAGAAGVYAGYDEGRSMRLLGEAVGSANKIEGFTGDTAVARNLQIGDFFFSYKIYDGGLGFNEVVGRQGGRSFRPTLQEVQALKDRLPRLKAIIAACGAALASRQA